MEFITNKIYKNKRNQQLTVVLKKKQMYSDDLKYKDKVPTKVLVKFLE